jgi:hypothetical protein
MIDMNMYRQMHSKAETLPQKDDIGLEAFEREEAPSEIFLLLLQSKIQGFGFQDKKWSKFLPWLKGLLTVLQGPLQLNTCMI